MSLGDLVISLSANTATLQSDMGKANQIMERFAAKAIISAKQGETAIKSMSNASSLLQIQLNALGPVADRLQFSFKNLDIKSALNIEQEKAIAIASFEHIKNSGVASASEIRRAYIALNAKIDELNGHTAKNTSGMNLFGLTSVATIAKVQVLYSLINTTMSLIGQAPGRAVDAIETFSSQVVGNAAMITSMQKGVKDIGAAYLQNKAYAQSVQETLVKMDAETAASAQNLQDMNTQFMQQGILIDVNNKKQVEGFKSVANALAAITANDPNRNMQFAQEIRVLREMKDIGSNRLVQLLATQGVTKEIFENWKKTAQETGNYGYVLEKIGPYLQGFAAAQGDINNLWETVKSTMGTIVNEVLRGGLSKGFAELVEKMKELNKWATDDKEKIQAWLQDSWEKGKKVVEVFWEIAKLIAKFAEPLMWAAMAAGISGVTIKSISLYNSMIKAGEGAGIVTGAIKLMGLEIGVATGGITILLGLIITASIKLRQMYNDQQDLNKRVWEIRNAGKSEAADFTPAMLKQVLAAHPGATNAQINEWLQRGALSIGSKNGQQTFSMNDALIKFLEADASGGKGGLPTGISSFNKAGKAESVSSFNSIIEKWNSLNVKAEPDEFLRNLDEINKQFSDLQTQFEGSINKSELAKQGITASSIASLKAANEDRIVHEAANKDFDKWYNQQIEQGKAQIKLDKELHDTKIKNAKERLAITEIEAKNNIANIESLLTFGDISRTEAAKAMSVQYKVILQAQEEASKSMDRGTSAWLQQQNAIDRTKDTLLKFKKEIFDSTIQGSVISSLKDYAASATDIASQMKNATTNAFKSMEDAIVKFAQTGKFSFTDFANSVIADLIRIAVRSQITGPLASIIGTGLGSIFGGVSSFSAPSGVNSIMNVSNSSAASSTPSVMVNIENKTNGDIKQGSTDVRFDGKQFVINTIVENVNSNGVLRGMMANAGV